MNEALPLLGMFDLAMFLVKALAVLGGAAAGGLGSGAAVRLSSRMLTRKAPPQGPRRVAQVLGACGLGFAVYLWVFGEGGGGLGWGGSQGLGGGKGESAGLVDAKSPSGKDTKPISDPSSPETGEAVTLRVQMLGGDRVLDQRFYLLEGERDPLRLEELRRTLKERKEKKTPVLKGIEIVIYDNSVAQDHPAVRDLEKWARANDIAVSLSFPKRDAP